MSKCTTAPPSQPPAPAITLDEIIKREPRIVKLLRWTHAVRDASQDQEVVCFNALDVTCASPLIDALVGCDRQPQEVVDYLFKVAWDEGFEVPKNYHVRNIEHARRAIEIGKENKLRPKRDSVLESWQAHELVRRTVRSQLPFCRNCRCGPTARELMAAKQASIRDMNHLAGS